MRFIQGVGDSVEMQVSEKNMYYNSNANLALYKLAFEETVPLFSKLSMDNENPRLLSVLTESLFNFNIQKKLTIINRVIPGMGFMANKDSVEEQSVSGEVVPVVQIQHTDYTEDPQYYDSSAIQNEIVTVKEESLKPVDTLVYSDEQLEDMDFLMSKIYLTEKNLPVSKADFDMDFLLGYDATIDVAGKAPKIMIMHTHSQEAFKDSRPGVESDTIVGVGAELANVLRDKYGISVIHNKNQYDMKNGVLDRDGSYDRVDRYLPELIEEYPSVEVIVDLHRDGIPEKYHLVTEVNGKQTAQFMFVNGMCKKKGWDGVTRSITYLPNPYLQENMAFSLQMQLKAAQVFPDLSPSITRRIYLKPYRYSTYLKEKSLLVELGAQNNTIQEAMNAVEPLAEVLYRTLTEGNDTVK